LPTFVFCWTYEKDALRAFSNKGKILNIFATSECPLECAKFLDNKRVLKMVLETAQLLSSAIRLNGYNGTEAYKITHKNHPSSKWCRATRGNYEWLLAHFKALCDEYTRRCGKVHASSKLYHVFEANAELIPEGEKQPFSNNARNLSQGVDFSTEPDTLLAYRRYLAERWEKDKREPKWS
jgi:hypothetical protein